MMFVDLSQSYLIWRHVTILDIIYEPRAAVVCIYTLHPMKFMFAHKGCQSVPLRVVLGSKWHKFACFHLSLIFTQSTLG